MNHENFSIDFKNISSSDKISVILENYDEVFTNESNYQIIKVTFENNKIIESFEEDIGQYAKIDEDFDTKHINNIIDKTSLIQTDKLATLKIEDLSPNEIGLAVNIDFQVTVYRNNQKIIDRENMGFDDNLFETEECYDCYYYSNFEVDLAKNIISKKGSTSDSIIENEPNYSYVYFALTIFIMVVVILILVVIIKNRKKKEVKLNTMVDGVVVKDSSSMSDAETKDDDFKPTQSNTT
ncbi:hypothetical protein IKG33_01575 [Candidatus Saccharibacteria bacterium]|nr:hypothetical protein [Candidatus Saccharibacteria bacterium]